MKTFISYQKLKRSQMCLLATIGNGQNPTRFSAVIYICGPLNIWGIFYMAKGRILSKSISTSDKVRTLIYALNKLRKNEKFGEFAALLFSWITPHTDDYGICDGSPYWIQSAVVPILRYREIDDIILCLTAMDLLELIYWYEAKGKMLLSVPNFDEHQYGLHKRTEPKYPQWSMEFPRISGKFREKLGKDVLNIIEENIREYKLIGREGKGREVEGEVSGTPPPYKLILDDLNSKLHKKFQVTDQVKKDINARWKTGKYTLEDFIKVHDIKINEWNHPPGNGQKDMRPYLRPSTLYGNKFDGYLNQVEPNKDDNRFSESGRKTIKNLTEDLQERGLLNG